MRNFIILITFTLFITSCATHMGVMSGNASISDANFNLKGLAIGTSKTTHVLGIGGLGKDALILEAKRNLYTNYPLKQGQALANVTVDIKRSFFPFVATTKATITADVIDFNNKPDDSSFDAFNKQFNKTYIGPFTPNQKVGVNKLKNVEVATVVESDKKRSTILIQNKNGNYRLKKVKNKKLFGYNEDSTDKYKIGETVKFELNGKTYAGTIQGINDDIVIVYTFITKSSSKMINVKKKNIIE